MTRTFNAFVLFVSLLAAAAQAQNQAVPRMQQPAGPAYPARQASDIRPIAPGAVPGAPPVVAMPSAAQPIAPLPEPPEWAKNMGIPEQQWIDQVLQFWETRSDKVKVFECKFNRWDYDGGYFDPASGKRHPRTYAAGNIKYAQPDKGLYHVEKLVAIMPPAAQGQEPQRIEQNPDLGEHWVCDGEKIFSFEANKKQVTVSPLPPDMRGKAIADGPLPFMFGAKAQTIKARYWIRGLEGKKDKYWLEAVPKSRQDAQNFKMVRIVLDQKEYLPESLEIFAPNYDPPRNDARQSYQFVERKEQDENKLKEFVAKGLLGIFMNDFSKPAIPGGWKVVNNDPANVPPPQQAAGPAPPARQPNAIPR